MDSNTRNRLELINLSNVMTPAMSSVLSEIFAIPAEKCPEVDEKTRQYLTQAALRQYLQLEEWMYANYENLIIKIIYKIKTKPKYRILLNKNNIHLYLYSLLSTTRNTLTNVDELALHFLIIANSIYINWRNSAIACADVNLAKKMFMQ